jgi:beta-lactamase class A
MVHNAEAVPLFRFGQPPSDELTVLAEDGDPSELVRYYTGRVGVYSMEAFDIGAVISVNVTHTFPYCSIAVNAEMLQPGNEILPAEKHDWRNPMAIDRVSAK